MTGFQTQVNMYPAPAVAGDFASANPRATALAGPGGLIAGPEGVTVAKFAWIDTDGVTAHNYGTGVKAPRGFVHREMNAVITTYLAETSMVIPGGFPVTVFDNGDFWVVNSSSTAAVVDSQVYADYSNGDAYGSGSAPTGASVTAAIGATFTGTATNTTQLVASSVTGLISIGDTVSGTGITAGTTILSQLLGTTGGAGTYQLSTSNTMTGTTATCFGAVMNVTVVGSGTLEIGDALSSPATAVISSQISGATGGIGVYRISVAATAYTASGAITATGGVLTAFYVRSSAGAGELMKISTWS